MKLPRLAAITLLVPLALTACSGGDAGGGAEAGRAEPSPSASAGSAEAGIISPDTLPEVPGFANEARGVIADVEVASCDPGPGEVSARGTATNSGKYGRDLVVVINWAVTSTSDVVARGIATVEDVEPGESGDWEVEAEFDVDQPVGCVPTALAGQLRD